MAAAGAVVVHGTASLGHPHKEFLAGKFARRAMYVFDAKTGRFLWGGLARWLEFSAGHILLGRDPPITP